MSALIGLYHLDGQQADPGLLERMAISVEHCGPDGSGTWSDGPVGLSHRMLHTTPESLYEHLPLVSGDGTIAITADARIDNRAELIARLQLSQPGIITDSELILAAYERWGEGCVNHLVGDFAFAIWDTERRSLFCARDHFAIRPFYYHFAEGQHFACATEIKALFAYPGVPQRLNEVRIADFLATMREDAANTIYEDIFRLPAAHALSVRDGCLKVWRYYTLAPAQDVPSDASDADYEARFRELFAEAVRARLRSAFPVGSELSGGLDSSSVTCMARTLMGHGEPLHTFSLVYEDVEACDERPHIDAVLQEGNYEPHFIRGDRLGPLSNIDEVYDYLDDGLASGNQHLVWALKKTAGQAGVRVLLDGNDGDNVVDHGLLYLKELAAVGDWEAFARESRMVAARFQTASQRHNFEDSFSNLDTSFAQFGLPRFQYLADEGQWARFAKEVQAVHRVLGVKRSALLKRYWRRLVQPKALLRARRKLRPPRVGQPILPLLSAEFAERVDLDGRLKAFGPGTIELTTVRDTQRRLLSSPRIQTAMELTTHATAAHGVEIRHPFLDKRLVEYCLALPPSQSLKDGWTRSILRRSLRGVLPESIRLRVGKAWMSANFKRGLYEQDRALLEEHVTDLGMLRPYVDIEYVNALYEKGDSAEEIEHPQLARIAVLSMWLKKRFAGAKPEIELAPEGLH